MFAGQRPTFYTATQATQPTVVIGLRRSKLPVLLPSLFGCQSTCVPVSTVPAVDSQHETYGQNIFFEIGDTLYEEIGKDRLRQVSAKQASSFFNKNLTNADNDNSMNISTKISPVRGLTVDFSL